MVNGLVSSTCLIRSLSLLLKIPNVVDIISRPSIVCRSSHSTLRHLPFLVFLKPILERQEV